MRRGLAPHTTCSEVFNTLANVSGATNSLLLTQGGRVSRSQPEAGQQLLVALGATARCG